MNYNFDEVISRQGTDCMKHEALQELCGRTDVLPMWVADMDFRTPPFIFEAIQNRMAQGILGYTGGSPAYKESIVNWTRSHYGMEITPEMIQYVPGIVPGIFLAVNCFTEKQEKILIMQPVYHPFRLVPEASSRVVVQHELVRTETGYTIDFEALERDIQGCKLLILCNPHNPGGICWTREQLQQVAHIAKEAGVLVISDEIHCDMVLAGCKHIPFSTVSDEALHNCITFQAPTKTYNLPGVVASHAIVQDEAIRERFFGYVQGNDMSLGNVFAFDCVRACYSEEGDEWRKQMLAYVQGNIDYLDERLKQECPAIRVMRPQASFLVWLDCRGLGMTQPELEDFFVNKAKVFMNPGTMFGDAGTGYFRLNVGCPRSTVEQAVNQVVEALKEADK